MGGVDGNKVFRAVAAVVVGYIVVSQQIARPYGIAGMLVIAMIIVDVGRSRRLLIAPDLSRTMRRGQYYGALFGSGLFWALGFVLLYDLTSVAPLSLAQFWCLLLPVTVMVGCHLARGRRNADMAPLRLLVLDLAAGAALLAFAIAVRMIFGADAVRPCAIALGLAVAAAILIRAVQWAFGQCWPNLFARVGALIAAASASFFVIIQVALAKDALQTSPATIVLIWLSVAAVWLAAFIAETRWRSAITRSAAA